MGKVTKAKPKAVKAKVKITTLKELKTKASKSLKKLNDAQTVEITTKAKAKPKPKAVKATTKVAKAKVAKPKVVKVKEEPKVTETLAKVKFGTNYGTAQIYNNGPEMALVNDDNQQVGTTVFCKDFFQDAIVAELHGTTCGIYGYKYNPKTDPPLPKNNVKVVLGNAKDKAFKEKIDAVRDFVNQFEEEAKTEKSTVQLCENPPSKYPHGMFLVTGDKRWMLAPPLLSGWTLIVRNGLQHTVGRKWRDTVNDIIKGKIAAAQSHDATYLQHGLPGLNLIIQKGIETLFGTDQKKNYPKNKAGGAMHHYSGIVSYGSKRAKSHFPMWVYPDKASNPPGVCFS